MKEENKTQNVVGTNEKVGVVVDVVGKKRGMFRKDIAEGTGVSNISLSITLSDKSPSVVTTKKLLEIAKVMNSRLVIGILPEEDVDEFYNRVNRGNESSGVHLCPNCGTKFDIKNISENNDDSFAKYFVVCDNVEIDKDAKKEQKERILKTYEKMGKKIAQRKEE